MEVRELEKKAAQIRLESLMAVHKAGFGFSGSMMSVVEILVSLYYGEFMGRPLMNFSSAVPGHPGQDYVVLSKGHAAAVQYTILADLGFFDKNELNFLSRVNSLLPSRPSGKVPGVPCTIASHGQGLSMALGIAMALKMDREPNKVYAILGDGELQEGQVWEAAMAAGHHKLENLVVFIDNNRVQAETNIAAVMNVDPIQDKFESFGWSVMRVGDGHDFDKILNSFSRIFTVSRKPICVICNTVAGKGIYFAEGKPGYQRAFLSEDEMREIIPKLKELV